MKLLIVLGIQEHEADIRRLLHAAGVALYSQLPMEGHRQLAAVPDLSNWFGGTTADTLSLLAFAFVPAPVAERALAAVQAFNAQTHSPAPLHAFLLAVEASAEPIPHP